MKLILGYVVLMVLTACGAGDSGGSGGSGGGGGIAAGKRSFEAGELRSAEIEISNHLKSVPGSAQGHWLMARLRLAQGNPIAAEVSFRRAIKYGAAPGKVLPELAESLLAQEKYNTLIDELGSKKLGDPAADAAIQTAVANAYARQNNLEPARQAVEAALSIQPDYLPALVLNTRLMAGRGQLTQAVQMLDGLLARPDAIEAAWTLKGDLLVETKAPEADVLAAYRKAAALGPSAVHPHTMIMSMLLKKRDLAAATAQLAAMRTGLPMHPNTGFFDARVAYERGDFQRARLVMVALLGGAPDNPTFLLLAGRTELALGSYQQAQSMFEKVVIQDPDSAQARHFYALTLLANGLPDKAIDALRPALRGADVQVESFALAARIYSALGDRRGEDAAFANAERANPQHPMVRMAKALTQLAKGNLDAGFAQLQQVAEGDASSEADLALIGNALRLKRFELARRAIDRLELKQPSAALPHALRGEVAVAAGDAAGAREHFEKALQKQSDLQSAIDSLARLDELEKKPEAALARYRAQVARNPSNAYARVAMARIRARMQAPQSEVTGLLVDAVKSDPRSAVAHEALIRQYQSVGRLRDALLAAQRATTALPNEVTLTSLLGEAQMQEEDYNQAILSFRRVVALRPRSAEALVRLAEAQSARGDFKGANDSLTQALRLAPEWPPLQEAAFAVAMRDKRIADALIIARRVQTKLPDQALGFRLEGDAEAAQKRWEPAVAMFRKALTRQNIGNTAVRLHVALQASGNMAAAAQFAQEWRSRNKSDTRFVNHLAETALVARDLAGAEALFAQVVGIDPKNPSALNNLAYLALGRENSKALSLAERAVAAAPNNPLILDTLARAYAETGQLDRAIETQKRALDLTPGNGGLRLGLAKLYLRANRKERARHELIALAQLGNKFSAQEEVTALTREAMR